MSVFFIKLLLYCFVSLRLTGVFGVGQLNDVSQILPRPTMLATATKFGELGQNWPEIGLNKIYVVVVYLL